MKEFVRRLRGPALLIILGFLGHHLLVKGAEEVSLSALFVLAVRVFATAWGGWLVVRGRGPLRAAAIAGIALLVLDMVILTGASFLIRGEVRAFVNAVIATVITAPLAAALAALGGYAAQQTARRTAA